MPFGIYIRGQEEMLKLSFNRCNRKKTELLKATCKHPWQQLRQIRKGSSQRCTLFTEKAKDNLNIFTKTEQGSSACFRNL